jgi:hypothetical protein
MIRSQRRKFLQNLPRVDELARTARKGVRHYAREIDVLIGPDTDDYFKPNCRSILLNADQTTESAISLIVKGGHFDAEILLRTVLELTLSLWRIVLSEDPAAAEQEFFESYFRALIAQDSTKTHELGEMRGGGEWIRPLIFLGRPRPEVPKYFKDAQGEFSRSQRKPLLTKWSAGEILSGLSEDERFARTAKILKFTYSSGSHLAHGDPCGLKVRYATGPSKGIDSNLDNLFWACVGCMSAVRLAKLRLTAVKWLKGDLVYGEEDRDSEEAFELFKGFSAITLAQSIVREDIGLKYSRSEFRDFLLDLARQATTSE